MKGLSKILKRCMASVLTLALLFGLVSANAIDVHAAGDGIIYENENYEEPFLPGPGEDGMVYSIYTYDSSFVEATGTNTLTPHVWLNKDITSEADLPELEFDGDDYWNCTVNPEYQTTVENGVATQVITITTTVSGSYWTPDGTYGPGTITITYHGTNESSTDTELLISNSNVTLFAGDKETLVAKLSPSGKTPQDVEWTSSNSAVATVENGVVTAVAEGTATITAKANGLEGASSITVYSTDDVITFTEAKWAKYVEGIVIGGIEPASHSGFISGSALPETGKTANTQFLTVFVKPEDANKTVTFTFNEVAGVNNRDTAKLQQYYTVQLVDGVGTTGYISSLQIGPLMGGFYGEVQIDFKPAPIEVSSVTFDKTSLALHKDDTATLTATVAPDNASDKTITWKSSDEAVATVDNAGKVTAVANGKATITATTANGKEAACDVVVADVFDFAMDIDKDVVKAGEQVTVTISKPFTITTDSKITNINLQLYYNTDALAYESHAAGDLYKDAYTIINQTNKKMVLIDRQSMTMTPFEVPAGEVVKVVFTAKEDMTADHVLAEFRFRERVSNQTAQTTEKNTYETILAYKEHTWDDGTIVEKAICGSGVDGLKTFECTFEGCEATKEETITAKAEHDMTTATFTEAAKCKNEGCDHVGDEATSAAIKAAAKAEVEGYKNAADYRDAEKAVLADEIADAKEAIEAAATEEAVEKAVADAKAAMDAIKTDAELDAEEAAAALAAAKTAAKEEIAGYKNADDYREAQQETLAEEIEKANAAIDAATSEAEVAEAVADAKAAMDAIKTDAELDAEELAAAKVAAKEEVESYKDAADYRDAEKVDLADEVAKAKEAIDAATTEDAVAKAVADAKAAMDAIKTDAELDAEEAAAALAAAKTAAKEEIASYKNAADYRETQQETLAEEIEKANTAIDAATSEAEVAEAVADAKAAIDAIKTDAELDAEELAAAKVAGKDEVAGYKNEDDYRDAQKAELTAVINAANTEIDAATTVEAVESAVAEAKEKMDLIKTDAELDAEELAAAKAAAKEEVESYKDPEDYRDAEKAALADEIADAKEAIDAAATEEAVEKAVADAKAAMDAIKTDDQYKVEEAASLAAAKEAAKEALEDYKDPADYREEQQAELAAAIEAGKGAIDAAATEAKVAEELAAAKEAIDAIKTDAEFDAEEALAAAKEAAKEEVAGYKNADDYREEQQAELAAVIEAAKEAIDAATTEDAVEEAVTEAKAKMDLIKTDAQLDAEEAAAAALEAAKEEAKEEIAGYKNADDYRDAQKAELAAEIAKAKEAIEAATTEEAVEKAVADAKAAMDKIKTDAQLDKEEADALVAAKEAAKEEIAGYKDAKDYRDAQKAELAAVKEAAYKAIDAAATKEAVEKAVTDAKAAMDKIKTDAQLDKEEANASDATKPGTNSGTKPGTNSPETGDNSMIGFYTVLLILAAGALGWLVVYRRRRQA